MGKEEVGNTAPVTKSPRAFAVTQLVLCYLLIARIGPIVASSVFTGPIAGAAAPPGALDHVWPLGRSLSTPLFALLIVPLSAYFHAAKSPTRAARHLVRLGAASCLLVLLAAAGAALSNAPLVLAGALSLALPAAACSPPVIRLIAELVPAARFGAAMAALSLMVGASVMVSTALEHFLLEAVAPPVALAVFGVLMTLVIGTVSLFITFPGDQPPVRGNGGGQQEDGELATGGDECEQTPLLSNSDPREDDEEQVQSNRHMSLRHALRSRTVWLFVLCISCKRAVYPLMPYFFEIGGAYGASQGDLVALFELGTVLSVAYNMTLSFASDALRTRTGLLRSGGRNMLALTLVLQTGALLVLATLPQTPARFRVWAVCITLLRVASETHYSFATIVARDLFGATNVALSSGSMNGAAIGFGVSVSTAALVVSLALGSSEGAIMPQDYVPFYRFAVVGSIVSLFLLWTLRFPEESKTSLVE